MGKTKRRWNSERYPKAITVRVTKDEHGSLMDRAARHGLSASRFLVRSGTSRPLPPARDTVLRTAEDRKDMEFLLYELRKVGNNLNQLARHSNQARLVGRRGAPKERVDQVANTVDGLINLIKNRL